MPFGAISVVDLFKSSTGYFVPGKSDPNGNQSFGGAQINSVVQNVGTIAATSTLQATALVANPARISAAVINGSTNQLSVLLGTSTAAASLLTALPVQSLGTLEINRLVGNYQGQVNVAGTSGSTYYTVEAI